MTLTDAIKRAREIEAAATPGAWSTYVPHGYACSPSLMTENGGRLADFTSYGTSQADAAFIATSRNAWLAALAVVEAASKHVGNIDLQDYGKAAQALVASLDAFAESMK